MAGMVYAFYEPTLLDFVKQSMQQECRVQIPPRVTNHWSPKFDAFREDLVNYLLMVHSSTFWENLLQSHGVEDPTSPVGRDILLTYIKALCTEYITILWTDGSRAVKGTKFEHDVQGLLEATYRWNVSAESELHAIGEVPPRGNWEGFMSCSNLDLDVLWRELCEHR